MPKIIENLPQRLMEEARRQIRENGYAALTVRSVAKGCGVGVGTVYNYYSSKDALVAAFMLADWKECITAIEACSRDAQSWEPVLDTICERLKWFLRQHKAVFEDQAAAVGFAGSSGRYHSLLRAQLAKPLERFCRDTFTAEFIAQAVLTWAVEGKTADQLKDVLKRIF